MGRLAGPAAHMLPRLVLTWAAPGHWGRARPLGRIGSRLGRWRLAAPGLMCAKRARLACTIDGDRSLGRIAHSP
jgi:hypothetical protein